MHKGIIKEAVIGVLKMRWNSFFNSYAREKKEPGAPKMEIAKEKSGSKLLLPIVIFWN